MDQRAIFDLRCRLWSSSTCVRSCYGLRECLAYQSRQWKLIDKLFIFNKTNDCVDLDCNRKEGQRHTKFYNQFIKNGEILKQTIKERIDTSRIYEDESVYL